MKTLKAKIQLIFFTNRIDGRWLSAICFNNSTQFLHLVFVFKLWFLWFSSLIFKLFVYDFEGKCWTWSHLVPLSIVDVLSWSARSELDLFSANVKMNKQVTLHHLQSKEVILNYFIIQYYLRPWRWSILTDPLTPPLNIKSPLGSVVLSLNEMLPWYEDFQEGRTWKIFQ